MESRKRNNHQNSVYFAIADPTRREILDMLTSGNLALKEISSKFPITRTAVSKHLKILQDADLIRSQKIGRETVYQASPEPLMEVQEWLEMYAKFWDKKLNCLKSFVENNDL